MRLGLVLFIFVLATEAAKIETKLLRKIWSEESADVFVSFQAGTHILKTLSEQSFANRTERGNRVNALLRSNANKSQARVLQFLANFENEIRGFWISNQIYIKNANRRLIDSLAVFPEVSSITEEKFTHTYLTTNGVTSNPEHEDEISWGLRKIQAPEVWNLEEGSMGEDVVVGDIGTGALHTHEALRDNFLGDYGWFDPYTGDLTPNDELGFGTISLGIAVGRNGIGVAPGSQWMACRGCAWLICSESDLLACGQFMQCPTLADGSNPDCSKSPKIVSCPWASVDGGDDIYYPTLEAWAASDIVGIFPTGDRQPWQPICGGVGSPADHPLAIAVGNTDENDALWASSDQGPTLSALIKPDVSAPGISIKSAWIDSEDSYIVVTGGMAASSHIAGVAALLASKKPDMTVAQIRSYLTYGNEQEGLVKPGNDCGGVSETLFPNNAFGHGRISALNSFMKLLEDHF